MLGGDVATMLPALRAQAESLMQDRVRVSRGSGEPVFDEDTGEYVDQRSTIYEGKGRVRLPRAWGNAQDEQGATITVQPATVSIPIDGTEAVTIGDHVEVVASSHDQGTVGVQFRVSEVHWQTHSTARRLGVELES